MPHRAPNNLPQHIPAPFIRRHHSIANQKRRRPRMIRDHAQRSRPAAPRLQLFFLLQTHAAQFRRALDQRHKQIRVVVRHHLLQHRRRPLQPHARIHRGLRQRLQLPLASRLNCMNTKFQISTYRPHSHGNSHDSVAFIRRRRPHIEKNLAARPARPRIAHRPKVIFQARNRHHAIRRRARGLPQIRRFRIHAQHLSRRSLRPAKYREIQFLHRQPKPLR